MAHAKDAVISVTCQFILRKIDQNHFLTLNFASLAVLLYWSLYT